MVAANWWIEDNSREAIDNPRNKLIRKAGIKAHLEVCLPRIRSAREARKITPKGLAKAIRLNPGNLARLMKGEYPNHHARRFYALAGVLRISVHDFYPPTLQWLARVTEIVLGDSQCEFTVPQCELFARYCLQLGPLKSFDNGIDADAVQRLQSEHSTGLSDDALCSFLERITAALTRRLENAT